MGSGRRRAVRVAVDPGWAASFCGLLAGLGFCPTYRPTESSFAVSNVPSHKHVLLEASRRSRT